MSFDTPGSPSCSRSQTAVRSVALSDLGAATFIDIGGQGRGHAGRWQVDGPYREDEHIGI